MRVVELIDWPEGSTIDGRPPVRFERIPLDGPFTFGGSGRLRVPGVEPERFARLDEAGTFAPDGLSLHKKLGGGVWRCRFGAASVLLAVRDLAEPSLAWPKALDALIRTVTPGRAGLDVLADALLEQGHPLGARLRGLEPAFEQEARWAGGLPLYVDQARLDLTWERHAVSHANIRGLPALDLLSAQAVTHLVQALDVAVWGDAAESEAAALTLVDRLTANGLPWLGRLTLHGLGRQGSQAVTRAWRTGRWRDRVASGCILSTPAPRALVLEGRSTSHELPARGTVALATGIPLGWSTPAPSVRLRHHTVELTVTGADFELNGVRRAGMRFEVPSAPWVIPLLPGDTFDLGAGPWRLLARDP